MKQRLLSYIFILTGCLLTALTTGCSAKGELWSFPANQFVLQNGELRISRVIERTEVAKNADINALPWNELKHPSYDTYYRSVGLEMEKAQKVFNYKFRSGEDVRLLQTDGIDYLFILYKIQNPDPETTRVLRVLVPPGRKDQFHYEILPFSVLEKKE